MVRSLAQRWGFVCRPAKGRFGTRTVPLGGGISIFTTLALVVGATAIAIEMLFVPGKFGWIAERVNIDPADFSAKIHELVIIMGCASVLFAVGLWDDIKRLGPVVKRAVQFAVAMAAAVVSETRGEFLIEKLLTMAVRSIFAANLHRVVRSVVLK